MRARRPGWKRRGWLACSLLVGVSLAACGDDDAGADAGRPDTGPTDTGPRDTGPRDTGTTEDAGPIEDAGPVEDAGLDEDMGTDLDAGPDDAGPPDGGPEPADAGDVDMGCYSGPTTPVTVDPALNLVALHDSTSSRHRTDCLTCHADVLGRGTLDPAVRQIHPLMIDVLSRCVTDETCRTCHITVDLSGNRSAGNLRRQVDVSSCARCHSRGSTDYYLP